MKTKISVAKAALFVGCLLMIFGIIGVVTVAANPMFLYVLALSPLLLYPILMD